jgi:hypothetical protein
VSDISFAKAIYHVVKAFALAFLVIPAAIIFFAYLTYIVVKVFQEWQEK